MSSCAHSRGWGAVIRRPTLTGVALAALLLSGCAVGGDEIEGSAEPRADLARKAEVAAKNLARAKTENRRRHVRDRDRAAAGPKAAGQNAGGEYAGAVDTARTGTTQSGARGKQSSAIQPDASWTSLMSAEDPVGDHGNGPGYADLTRVEFSEHDGMLATTVTVASLVPGALADREVQGVGIDIYRSSSEESDYQVFLDGGTHGWRAFLQTPDGFVDFPGTFTVRGRTLTAVVPWDAVGGRDDVEASVFVDWSSGVGRLSTDGTSRLGLVTD